MLRAGAAQGCSIEGHRGTGIPEERTMRQILTTAAIALGMSIVAAACAGRAPEPQLADDPTASASARGTHLPTCRWIPVAPEWNEPCTQTNHGAKLEVTLRSDGRASNVQKQTATCECD